MNVLQYTKDLDDNDGVNGTEVYQIAASNCVVKASEAIQAAGILFSVPTTPYTFTLVPEFTIPGTNYTVPAQTTTQHIPTPGAFGEALVAAGGERIIRS